MSIVFNENHKNGRLWIEDECIYGPKLEETLESSGIINGQLVYAEYMDENNLWPIDKAGTGAKQPGVQGDS